MTKTEATGFLINAETGEIKTEVFEGDRILRDKSFDFLSNTVEVGKNDYFVKTFVGVLPKVLDVLTPTECKMLLTLLKYLSKDSGVLNHSNGVPVTKEHLLKAYKSSIATAERAIKGLCDKDIIQAIKRPQGRILLVNPYVVMNGRRVSQTCYDVFYKSVWAKQ